MPETDDPIYDRPNVYEDEDGTMVYRASSLGGCMQGLIYARQGVTASQPPEFMLEKFQEGKDFEDELLRAGLETLGEDWFLAETPEVLGLYGTPVRHDDGWQVEVEVPVRWKGGRAVVRCHPDGIIINRLTQEAKVVEVKFLGDSMFRDYAKRGVSFKDFYLWQSRVERVGTGLGLVYIVGEKVRREVGGEEVLSIGKIKVDQYPLDASGREGENLTAIKARVLEVEKHVREGTTPGCPATFDFPCGYFELHEERDGAGEWEEIEDDALKVLAGSYITDMMQRAVLDGTIEEARKQIHKRLGELEKVKGRVETGMGGLKVSITPGRDGNVSWARAYQGLSKETGVEVDVEKYRGKAVEEGVRLEIEKGDGDDG